MIINKKNKELDLTITERIKANFILNEFKGSLDSLAIILEDIKQFPLSSEELKKVNGKIIMNPDRTQSINWDSALEHEIAKKIIIQDATLEYLKSSIKNKSKKGDLGIGDEAVLTLLEKLEN